MFVSLVSGSFKGGNFYGWRCNQRFLKEQTCISRSGIKPENNESNL
jgi:hypothetical protein